jgi:phosphopantetheinyl transferase (holo-ACP synthase)
VFLRWWVRKEAVVKALGLGLAVDVATVDVSDGRVPRGAADLGVVHTLAGGVEWTAIDLDVADDRVLASLAVGAAGHEPQVMLHRLAAPGSDGWS